MRRGTTAAAGLCPVSCDRKPTLKLCIKQLAMLKHFINDVETAKWFVKSPEKKPESITIIYCIFKR
jgi:hypothetical protein